MVPAALRAGAAETSPSLASAAADRWSTSGTAWGERVEPFAAGDALNCSGRWV